MVEELKLGHEVKVTKLAGGGEDSLTGILSGFGAMGALEQQAKNKPKPITQLPNTIAFFNSRGMPFNGKTETMGGSELAIANMAKQLTKLDWKIHVFCSCDSPGEYDGVTYHHYSDFQAWNAVNEPDVLVASRNHEIYFKRPNAKITVLWLHDLPDERFSTMLNVYENVDFFFFQSNFQREAFEKFLGIPFNDEDVVITRSGIEPAEFASKVKKISKRCIYYSTPFKGLVKLLVMWPQIHEAVPDAELHVYSGMNLYASPEGEANTKLYEELQKLPGVVYSPAIPHTEIIKKVQEADVLLYPNTYPETFCMVALEAAVSKTVTLSSNMGALPEVLFEDESVLIEMNEDYEKNFVEAAIKLLNDDEYRKQFTFAEERKNASWEAIASEWTNAFRSIIMGATKQRIAIITPNPHDFVWKRFHLSMMNLDSVHAPIVIMPKDFDIGVARNQGVKQALMDPLVKWIMFIDSDMVFDKPDVKRLMDHNKDIISGLYFKKNTESINFDLDKKLIDEYPQALMKVDDVGTGFMLVKRKVFERVKRPWFKATFDEIPMIGEDIYFCDKARAFGFEVWLDTLVRLGHILPTQITFGHYQARKKGKLDINVQDKNR